MLQWGRRWLGVKGKDGLLEVRSRHSGRTSRGGCNASRTARWSRLRAAEEVESQQRISRASGRLSRRCRLWLLGSHPGGRLRCTGTCGGRDVVTEEVDGSLRTMVNRGLTGCRHALRCRALKFSLFLNNCEGLKHQCQLSDQHT